MVSRISACWLADNQGVPDRRLLLVVVLETLRQLSRSLIVNNDISSSARRDCLSCRRPHSSKASASGHARIRPVARPHRPTTRRAQPTPPDEPRRCPHCQVPLSSSAFSRRSAPWHHEHASRPPPHATAACASHASRALDHRLGASHGPTGHRKRAVCRLNSSVSFGRSHRQNHNPPPRHRSR